jgi:hypothetical protein
VSADIVEIKTRPAAVKASVIEHLEAALEKARAGDIVTVGIATVHLDGSIGCSWSETDDFGRLVGSVGRLQYRINANQDPV